MSKDVQTLTVRVNLPCFFDIFIPASSFKAFGPREESFIIDRYDCQNESVLHRFNKGEKVYYESLQYKCPFDFHSWENIEKITSLMRWNHFRTESDKEFQRAECLRLKTDPVGPWSKKRKRNESSVKESSSRRYTKSDY